MTKNALIKTPTTLVTFVLDETGSMGSIKDDTIGGFNEYIDNLKKDQGNYVFSMVKFDSSKIEKVYVGEPLKNVVHLTSDTYRPGAMTPLVDAFVKSIHATEGVLTKRDDKPNVLFIVQTDGHENCSTEYTTDDLRELVKAKTAEGWVFMYLGAGIDAYEAARDYGIAAVHTASYDRGATKQAFASTARATTAYAHTGATMDAAFTSAEKESMGDKYDPSKTLGGNVPLSQTNSDTLKKVTSPTPQKPRKQAVDDFSF